MNLPLISPICYVMKKGMLTFQTQMNALQIMEVAMLTRPVETHSAVALVLAILDTKEMANLAQVQYDVA